MSAVEELEKIRNEALGCQKCRLKTTCTHVVFGEGSLKGSIMFIGEGPGRDEDIQGKPFVGRAGQLLDKILDAGGFNRQEHVYITNIVKCRPPGNRVPLPDEREACLPYLREQIKLLDPKIIVLLGATALQGLIDPKGKISQVRGQWQIWENRWVMPTYHPAALLRNPKLKAAVWQDIQAVVHKYREIVNPDHYSPYC